jgi:hypothetical protein
MLSLDDDKWKGFDGGYRINYDASIALRKLESLTQPNEKIWNELWEELFHQGDVGIASYACVPQIYRIYCEKEWIDHQLPNFVSAIEQARHESHNPELPKWLEQDYLSSLYETAHYCLSYGKEITDKNFSRSIMLLTAVLMKEFALAQLIELISIGDEEKIMELYCENF